MTNKKILLIIESLNSGGAERQICGLASMLTERGYDCKLVFYRDIRFYEPYLIEHNVEYEYRPELLNKFTRVFRLVKFLNKYKPTTIIAYLPMVNKTCCLARLFYKCNLIISERNNNIDITKSDTLKFNLYRLADVIVPNSYSQGDFITKNFPFLRNKVHTIINFVDLDHFTPPIEKIINPVFRVITVARYTMQKNCLRFLDCVAKLKAEGVNIHFDWYGSKKYDPEYYKDVETKAKDLNILDYISLNDSCENIVKEYQSADAFLLPSIFEGYPNVIVEAMSCGLPIICSRIFENPNIVKEGKNGFLFDPNDINEFVCAIKQTISLDDKARKEMMMNNRLFCIERNSSSKFIADYFELING